MLNIRDHGGQYGGGKYRKNSVLIDQVIRKTGNGGTLISETNISVLGGYYPAKMAVSMDGNRIAVRNNAVSESYDRLYVFDIFLNLISKFKEGSGATGSPKAMALNPDGTKLYVAFPYNLYVFDTLTGIKLKTLARGTENGFVEQVVFDSDGTYYLRYGGNLAMPNVEKYDSNDVLIWTSGNSATAVSRNGMFIISSNSDVIVFATANSSNVGTVSIACYSSEGVLKWSKSYGEVGSIYSAALSPYDGLIHATRSILTNQIARIDPTNGNIIDSYVNPSTASPSALNQIKFDEVGDLYYTDPTNKADIAKYSRFDRSLTWFAPAAISGSNGSIPEVLHFETNRITYISNGGVGGIRRIKRFNEYTILN